MYSTVTPTGSARCTSSASNTRSTPCWTGAKRDIALLGHVDAHAGDSVTVLDVSVASNRAALTALLERGVTVQYFDHHFADGLPEHSGLRAVIDTSPQVCTGILVDRYLQGRRRIWAVVAASATTSSWRRGGWRPKERTRLWQ